MAETVSSSRKIKVFPIEARPDFARQQESHAKCRKQRTKQRDHRNNYFDLETIIVEKSSHVGFTITLLGETAMELSNGKSWILNTNLKMKAPGSVCNQRKRPSSLSTVSPFPEWLLRKGQDYYQTAAVAFFLNSFPRKRGVQAVRLFCLLAQRLFLTSLRSA